MKLFLKFLKEKAWYLSFAAIVITVVLLSGKINTTTTMSKYKSTIDGTDSARVASWNISKLNKANGNVLDLEAGMNSQLNEGDHGNWFFEITNLSEVDAQLNLNDTLVKIKLFQNSFSTKSPKNIVWNFISRKGTPSDNPVSFSLTLYNGSFSDIVTGYTNGNNTITISQYDALDQDARKNYTEVFDEDAKKVEVFDIDDLNFTLTTEVVESSLLVYYLCEIPLSSLLSIDEDITSLDMSGDTKTSTFCLSWNVVTPNDDGNNDDDDDDDVISNPHGIDFDGQTDAAGMFRSYEYILKANKKDNQNILFTVTDPEDGKEYCVVYSLKEYFDYQIFISQVGRNGQPAFTFPSIHDNTELFVPFDELTDLQKNTIAGYPNSPSTVADCKKYVEKGQYFEYYEYLDGLEDVQNSLTYLTYGLQCKFEFEIKVEQVD